MVTVHSLAGAAHLRTDSGHHVMIGHHLACVGRRLRGVVLAGGCGAVVVCDGLDTVAGDLVLRCGLLDGQERTVLDPGGRFGVGAGQGEVDADLHHPIGSALIGSALIGSALIGSLDEDRPAGAERDRDTGAKSSLDGRTTGNHPESPLPLMLAR